jgi:peptidyl-prolyl cis-trans isomerase SurA
MKLRFLTLLCCVFVTLASFPAKANQAPSKYTIVATVNGDPVTSLELNERLDIMITSASLKDSVQLRQKFAYQALQTLVNEILQQQDAKASRVKATDEDLKFAIKGIEQNNKLSEGGFASFAASQGLTKESLIKQIKAQIVWKKILSNVLRPKVHVSTFEVEDRIEQLQSSKNMVEVYLSEIVLPLGKNKNESLETAQDLIEQIESGKNFSEIARQFSKGGTASEGGIIGWVPQHQLGGNVKVAVQASKPNRVLPPIISQDGVRIVKVGNRRTKSSKQNENTIKQAITKEKLELESKRYMKGLRSKAFIELRI